MSARAGRSRSGWDTEPATSSRMAAGRRPGTCRGPDPAGSTTWAPRPGWRRCWPAATRSTRPRPCCCGRGWTPSRAGWRRRATDSAPRRPRSRTIRLPTRRRSGGSCRIWRSGLTGNNLARMRIAAIQLDARVSAIAANLEACERLADRAAADGAEAIALPEFFTTGVGFVAELADAALAPDGAATELLRSLARRHSALVGGSFLCRDEDGEVRNAFLLATREGEIAGRHDKDLPTMWENALYVGGHDDGVIEADGLSIGAAVCWELMRTQTVRRLRARIDLALTGSGWWSFSDNWPPREIWRRRERANHALAVRAAEQFALFIGAPVAHAAHCGELRCPMPWLPIPYRGRFEGGARVVAANGRVLAARDRDQGEGFAIAEVEPGRRQPQREIPDRFWLHRRGATAVLAWNYQRLHGRRWYRDHVAGRPAREVRPHVPA